MISQFNYNDFDNTIFYAFLNAINTVFKSDDAGLKVLSLSRKMSIDLIKLFHSKIILDKSSSSRQEFSKNLLGVYGNFIATDHFENMGYQVQNEYPVIKEEKVVTKADLYFEDENGIDNYCEVKAVNQIIDNIRNYADEDAQNQRGAYTDKDAEILKYKQIGKRLIKQVDKLKSKNGVVNVIIFGGCYVDDIIHEELKKRDVNLLTLKLSVKDLEKMVEDTIDDVINYVKEIKKDSVTKIN